MIFISYIPMLTSSIGSVRPAEDKDRILKMLTEASEEYAIQAIAWMPLDKTDAYPILIVPHAKDIRDHMVKWADGKTKKYFTLVWDSDGSGYTIAILPNFHRSARRYHTKKQNKSSLTILGHIFTHFVTRSESFRASFLEDKETIRVGFSPRLPNEHGILSHFYELEMKVRHLSELELEDREIMLPYFQITH